MNHRLAKVRAGHRLATLGMNVNFITPVLGSMRTCIGSAALLLADIAATTEWVRRRASLPPPRRRLRAESTQVSQELQGPGPRPDELHGTRYPPLPERRQPH